MQKYAETVSGLQVNVIASVSGRRRLFEPSALCLAMGYEGNQRAKGRYVGVPGKESQVNEYASMRVYVCVCVTE
jgi:hypothetical protein